MGRATLRRSGARAVARDVRHRAHARRRDSVAQGTEVAVEPGGVGVNFALGQALDPINDLVERFSAAMLVATSSLALQGVLLEMSEWWATNLALVIAAAFALVRSGGRRGSAGSARAPAIRVLAILVFVRFAVPVFVLGSTLVFDTFLAAQQQAANDALTATGTEDRGARARERARREPRRREPSLTERLGNLVDDSLQALDVRDRMAALRESVPAPSGTWST